VSYSLDMPVEVSTTRDGIGVVYKSSGVLTGEELLEANEILNREIQVNPGFRYLLVDHGEVPEEAVDTASLKELARQTEDTLEELPVGLVAIIAPSDILYGLSRMWIAMATHPKLLTTLTRTREDSIAWLEEELSALGLPFQL